MHIQKYVYLHKKEKGNIFSNKYGIFLVHNAAGYSKSCFKAVCANILQPPGQVVIMVLPQSFLIASYVFSLFFLPVIK